MSKSVWGRVLFFGGVLLLAYLFTIGVVHYSHLHGRLATIPGYDDVAYFYSGLDMAILLRQQGFAGWAEHFRHMSCHAPYPEFMSCLIFYIGGWSYRTPYVSNVILVLVYLSCLLYFLRPFARYVQFALLGAFLCLPFASMIVAEFRPDMLWGTLLGFTVVYTITRRDFYTKLGPALAFGCLSGLSLLAKPSTFAMTGLCLCLAFGARFLLEFYRPVRPAPGPLILEAAKRLTLAVAIAFIISLPFFYFFGRAILDYFIYGVFGLGRKLFDAYAHHPWYYYIYGPAYDSNLAIPGDILILTLLAILVFCWKTLDRYDRGEIELCALLMLVAYGISIDSPIVSPFLGGCFYAPLIFLIAYVYGRYGRRLVQDSIELRRISDTPATGGAAIRAFRLGPGRQAAFLASCVLLLCFLSWIWPPYSDSAGTGLHMRSIQRKLFDYFATSPMPKSICMTQAAPIVRENILIWTRTHRNATPNLSGTGDAMTFDGAWNTIKKSDMIIAQDPGVEGTVYWLPVEKLQKQIVATLSASQEYHLIWKVNDGSGKSIYIFRRDIPAPDHVLDPGPL